jgi:hypothetical protein
MGFLDAVVGQCFRDEEAGRVAVFTGDRRNRGYLVKSVDEELKIRSFLKIFFSAQVSILITRVFPGNGVVEGASLCFGQASRAFIEKLVHFSGNLRSRCRTSIFLALETLSEGALEFRFSPR